MSDPNDVCLCGHVRDEHMFSRAECQVGEGCVCVHFEFDPDSVAPLDEVRKRDAMYAAKELQTPDAFSDRRYLLARVDELAEALVFVSDTFPPCAHECWAIDCFVCRARAALARLGTQKGLDHE